MTAMSKYQTKIAENCSVIELNDQSLEIVKKCCYLGGTIGARAGAFDSVKTMIKGSLCTFSILVLLLTIRGLALGTKGRFYSACVCHMEVRLGQLNGKI